jgi:uncharacterized protein YaiI (UPF0178 family)
VTTRIFVDADACPVKEEVYRVARRYGLPVFVVSNSWIRVPEDETIELVVVEGGFDIADDWIAERAGEGDVVLGDDVPLAARCIARGARVISFRGRELTEESIGGALATRELLQHLRYLGEVTGGPAPFAKQDRSRLLQQLDTTIQALRRARPRD